jgi:hypothetical protein
MVTIPDRNAFYSLYAHGGHEWKTYDKAQKAAVLHYPPGAVAALYYSYPTHREACVIRNTDAGPDLDAVTLPGLSKKVSLLFRVQASRVDKLKRAIARLDKHSGGAFRFDDGFYIRLFFLLRQRGKINYPAIEKLAGHSLGGTNAYSD